MRIELSKDDFDLLVSALRHYANLCADDYLPRLSARQTQRLETLRERVGECFTGWLDMDGD